MKPLPKYIKIVKCKFSKNAWRVFLVVGVQQFQVGACEFDRRDHARWYAEQLAKAIGRIKA